MRPDIAGQNIFNLLPDQYYKAAYTHNLLVMSLLHQMRGDLDLFKHTRELCLVDNEIADRIFFNDYTPAFWAEQSALSGGATPPGTLFLSMLDRAIRSFDGRRLRQEMGANYPLGIPNLHNLYFLLEDAIDWIGSQVNGFPRPFLGYFHLLPPHEPYTPHKDFVGIFRDGWRAEEKPRNFGALRTPEPELNLQRRLYDEYLANTDAEFGRLMDMLEEQGILDDTYVILTSDHGELFERGIRGHVTLTLYEGLSHVPLLIHAPGQNSRQDVFTRTSGVDLLPTMLQWTGQPLPDNVDGMVLPSYAAKEPTDRAVYALEAKSNAKNIELYKATVSMHRDGYKLIRYFGYTDEDIFELYDLSNDPEELVDIFNTNPTIAARLQQELQQKLAQVNEPFPSRS